MLPDESRHMNPVIRAEGEGQFIPVGSAGGGIRLKASGEETQGVMTVYESEIPPSPRGTPRHLHHHTDELFYVLEGEVTFEIAGQVHQARAGTFIFIPKETTHAFGNHGVEHARMLITTVPGGFEAVFAAMRAHADDPTIWEDINRRFDVHIVGPEFGP